MDCIKKIFNDPRNLNRGLFSRTSWAIRRSFKKMFSKDAKCYNPEFHKWFLRTPTALFYKDLIWSHNYEFNFFGESLVDCGFIKNFFQGPLKLLLILHIIFSRIQMQFSRILKNIITNTFCNDVGSRTIR